MKKAQKPFLPKMKTKLQKAKFDKLELCWSLQELNGIFRIIHFLIRHWNLEISYYGLVSL